MKAPWPRVHDLLEINGRLLTATLPSPPAWLADCLGEGSYVVARRSSAAENQIPIGICGEQRNQRFPTVIPRRLVRSILTPSQLLRLAGNVTSPQLPALRSLVSLKRRWAGLDWPWGPIGSVALTLATGSQRAKADSDLDIVLEAADRFTTSDAKMLFASALRLPARVDIRIETPFCGFSLFEFGWARSDSILLKTPEGPILGSDPWDPGVSSMAETARLIGSLS
jgi:phosphoribosyl-dephospho-CoA transferase